MPDDRSANPHPAARRSGPSQPILFDHVPKTGGTALHALLQQVLGAEACSPIITGSITQARAEFDRYQCVSGHLFFHPLVDVSDIWTVTVLRHPIRRLLSHLSYSRYDIVSTGDKFNQRARALDLETYVASDDPDVVRTISDTMVAHFAPLAWDGVEPLTPDRSLALAKEALERFNLVGLTERMNETADLLCWGLGLSLASEPRWLNVGSRSPKHPALSAAGRARLEQLNERDLDLYAHAQRLHDRFRRRALFDGRAVSQAVASQEAAPATSRIRGAPTRRANFGSREVELVRIDVFGQTSLGPLLLAGEIATIRVVFSAKATVTDLTVGIAIADERGRLVFATNTRAQGHALAADAGSECSVSFVFPNSIGVGHYVVGASLHPTDSHLPKCYHWSDAMTSFDVIGNLGWHFEGATKLHPRLEFSRVTPSPDPVDEGRGRLQSLVRIAPPLRDFRATLRAPQPIGPLPTGQLVAMAVEVQNCGTEGWPSLGERSVRVSYHWATPAGEIVVFDGERSHLPADIAPGERSDLWVAVRAPDVAGEYRLQLSLVQESVGWLEDRGGATVDIPVSVTTP